MRAPQERAGLTYRLAFVVPKSPKGWVVRRLTASEKKVATELAYTAPELLTAEGRFIVAANYYGAHVYGPRPPRGVFPKAQTK